MLSPELEPNRRRYFDCGQLDVIIEDPSDLAKFIAESRADTIVMNERFLPTELALVTNSMLRIKYDAKSGEHGIDGRIAFNADPSITTDDLLFNLGLSLIELHGHGASEIRGHGFGTDAATLLLHGADEPTGIVIAPVEATPDSDGEPISLVLMHSVCGSPKQHSAIM